MTAPLDDTPWPVLRQVGVRRHEGPQDRFDQDLVAVEAPVALVFNGISHAVMMATPQDLEVLGLGFALSEGLIADASECRDVNVRPHPPTGGQEVHLEIAPSAFAAFKARRRTLEGRTGCGLCGIESLAQWDQPPLPARRIPAEPLAPARILQAFAELPARQVLNRHTGGCHAAAWVQPDGTLAQVFEDVGRHNALDKLLGQRAGQRQLPPLSRGAPDGFVIVSSRASVELVRKCARLGVGALAAISAPTSLAVDVAHQVGLQLYGFCRGEQVVHYGEGQRGDGSVVHA